MKKAELEQKIEDLEIELDSLNAAYLELENENYRLSIDSDSVIKDLDDFIFHLKVEGLFTLEFENFLENYLKWY